MTKKEHVISYLKSLRDMSLITTAIVYRPIRRFGKIEIERNEVEKILDELSQEENPMLIKTYYSRSFEISESEFNSMSKEEQSEVSIYYHTVK